MELTETPMGDEVQVVSNVPKCAIFQFGWNGYQFFVNPGSGVMVAVRGTRVWGK